MPTFTIYREVEKKFSQMIFEDHDLLKTMQVFTQMQSKQYRDIYVYCTDGKNRVKILG